MTLVRYGRPRPVLPYTVLLKEDYREVEEMMLECLQESVDELLTLKEMDCVKRFVEKEFGLAVELWERDVHRDIGGLALSALPIGGGVGRVLLRGSRNPRLPFPVACCYDLRQH